MATKIEIKRLDIETSDGKQIPLSLDEAKELYEQLDELFGKKYIPSEPIIIYKDRYPWTDPYRPMWVYEGDRTISPNPINPGEITCDNAPDVRYEVDSPMCQVQGESGLNITYS